MEDIDITPFYKELGAYTIKHILKFSFYMCLVGVGALAAFLYISEREEKDDGNCGSDD